MPASQGNVSDQMADVDAIRVHSHIGLDINEFLLFHGSSLIERLCVKSLDTRFAGENTGKMFGDGSFASSKSDIYTVPDLPHQPGLRCLLVVRVCPGEPYRALHSDPGMKRPPDRPDGKGPLSSVVGMTQAERGMLAHREYIVYRESTSTPAAHNLVPAQGTVPLHARALQAVTKRPDGGRGQ